jgi:nondiscriminating glutamyl-tRNA synthetase
MPPEANPVRVRFAPSPTGHLHVGNARTALFNWLFARQRHLAADGTQKNGVMILRIEDTDLERSEARFEQQLFDDLRWLGLDWDEGVVSSGEPLEGEANADSAKAQQQNLGGPFGPYRQSERLPIYREQAERLLREGKAYFCFCTAEELEQERQRAIAEHRPQIYSGKCRDIAPQEAARRRDAGEPAAIRLRIPHHPIKFHDLVHGEVEFPNEVISDLIIMRSTGVPVYNYVVVVDDALMQITHVIRGDDHLSNTPKQVALYEALGWPVPEFAHLSTILGADRERLSKRHGATSIANFREMGVLPEALVNYLALLGWAPSGGDREVFSRSELLKEFDLKRVTPSPAIFDMEKLYWLNRHYIKASRVDQIADLAAPFFLKAGLLPDEIEGEGERHGERLWFHHLVELLAPSVDRLDQLPERAAILFRYDARTALAAPENAEVFAWPKTSAVIAAFAECVLAEPEGGLTAERFKAIMNEVKAATGAKGKELFHPVRIVVTGAHSGPEFDKLIPLIESGSKLRLPAHVKSVRARVQEFLHQRAAGERSSG